jgi:aryl-alcohol dehydrogenase-like predicted oxidoreductase
MTARNYEVVGRLLRIAEAQGMTLACLALAWALRGPGVASVIVGATRPEQVQENARAAGVTLEADLLREIEMVLSGS